MNELGDGRDVMGSPLCGGTTRPRLDESET